MAAHRGAQPDSMPSNVFNEIRRLLSSQGELLANIGSYYAAKKHGSVARYMTREQHTAEKLDEMIKNNRDLVKAAISSWSHAIRSAEHFLADREMVLHAVQRDGYLIKYASAELRKDPSIVFTAMENAPGFAFAYADDSLRRDKEFVLQVMEVCGEALAYVDKALQADEEVVLAAVKQNAQALGHAADMLLQDPDFAKKAVQMNGLAIINLLPQFQTLDICKLALQQNPKVYRFLKTDERKSLAMAAAQLDGNLLDYVPFHAITEDEGKDIRTAAVENICNRIRQGTLRDSDLQSSFWDVEYVRTVAVQTICNRIQQGTLSFQHVPARYLRIPWVVLLMFKSQQAKIGRSGHVYYYLKTREALTTWDVVIRLLLWRAYNTVCRDPQRAVQDGYGWLDLFDSANFIHCFGEEKPAVRVVAAEAAEADVPAVPAEAAVHMHTDS